MELANIYANVRVEPGGGAASLALHDMDRKINLFALSLSNASTSASTTISTAAPTGVSSPQALEDQVLEVLRESQQSYRQVMDEHLPANVSVPAAGQSQGSFSQGPFSERVSSGLLSAPLSVSPATGPGKNSALLANAVELGPQRSALSLAHSGLAVHGGASAQEQFQLQSTENDAMLAQMRSTMTEALGAQAKITSVTLQESVLVFSANKITRSWDSLLRGQ